LKQEGPGDGATLAVVEGTRGLGKKQFRIIKEGRVNTVEQERGGTKGVETRKKRGVGKPAFVRKKSEKIQQAPNIIAFSAAGRNRPDKHRREGRNPRHTNVDAGSSARIGKGLSGGQAEA